MSERSKKCKWCKIKKPLSHFPKVRGRSYRHSVCTNCMPFTIENVGRYLPDCEKCPLVENCRARTDLNLDPPCMAPDRLKLLGFMCMAPEDKKRARELYGVRLGKKYQVLPDSIDNYLAYYA